MNVVSQVLNNAELRVDSNQDQTEEEDEEPEVRKGHGRQTSRVGEEDQAWALNLKFFNRDVEYVRVVAQISEYDHASIEASEAIEEHKVDCR